MDSTRREEASGVEQKRLAFLRALRGVGKGRREGRRRVRGGERREIGGEEEEEEEERGKGRGCHFEFSIFFFDHRWIKCNTQKY